MDSSSTSSNLKSAWSTDDRHAASPPMAESYSLRLRRLSKGVRARLMNRPYSCDVDTLYSATCSTGQAAEPGNRLSLIARLRDRGGGSVSGEGNCSNGTKDAHNEFAFGASLNTVTEEAKNVKRKGSVKERLSFFRRGYWLPSKVTNNEADGDSGGGTAAVVRPLPVIYLDSAVRKPLAHSLSQMELNADEEEEAQKTYRLQDSRVSSVSSPVQQNRYSHVGVATERGNRNSAYSSSSLTTMVRPSLASGSSTGDTAHCTFSINSSIKQEQQPCSNPTARSPQLKQRRQQLIVDASEIAYSCDRFASVGRSLGDDKALPAYSTVSQSSSTAAVGAAAAAVSASAGSCDIAEAELSVDVRQTGKNNSCSSSAAKQQRTLRRAKAVDLGTADSPHSPSTAHDSQEHPSKRWTTKEARKGFRKASNDSILRKLIVASGKAFSEDSSLRVMNSVASMVSRADNSEVSSSSLEEQRGRKQFFAHYDCHSIAADCGPLLCQVPSNRINREHLAGPLGPFGSSCSTRVYQSQKNAGGGGGSFDVLTTATSSGASGEASSVEEAMSSSNAANVMPTDDGDGKSNDLILSCPFFRGEIGGEPTRHISLGTERYRQRWTVQDVSDDSPVDSATAKPTLTAAASLTSLRGRDNTETWHRIPSAAEACVLENLGNVYLGGRLCAYRQPQLVIEYVDHGAFYYRHCFAGKAHQNYFGIDENLGPIAVSIARDKLDAHLARQAGLSSPYSYRLIIRLSDLSTFRGSIPEESLPSYQLAKEQQQAAGQPLSPTSVGACVPQTVPTSSKMPVKEILELLISDHISSCLRLAVPLPRTEEMLLKLDEQTIYTRYKVGVLLCRAGQSTEEQMYNNECSTPAFDEFLDILGQRVRLKGFEKYKGGLDNKGDSTGTVSVYTSYQQYEIMFHVSTMLPFTPSNRQQLSRKRHIGNDIVTIIFQEPGATPFSPQTMRSQFQHVFVVVQAINPNSDKVHYSVAVTRYKDVPAFGPPLPANYKFARSQEFREFLLTKVINAENAVHVSAKFAAMAARTRREFMRELAENHCVSQSLESSSAKITSKILGTKRKDRPKPKVFLEAFNRGAIVWDVQVLTEMENFSLCCTIDCFLAISADYVVLIERSSETTLFCTATHSVIGWTSQGNSLKLYYDHADVIILRTMDDDDGLILTEIITRLKFVTKGCETQEMMLRHTACLDALDFRVQYEGIVDDVAMYGPSWSAGLRQGSRIVEICKVSVASLTYPKMLEFLKNPNSRILVVPPLEDGSPRRGCEDPHCPAVRGEVMPIVPSDWVSQPGMMLPHLPGHSPPSYDSFVSRAGVGYLLEAAAAGGVAAAGQSAKNGSRALGASSSEISPQACSSKSLDELRSRRSQLYSDAATCLDSGFDSTRNSADYHSATTSSLSSEDRWYQSLRLQAAAQRTKTLSSSSSGGSSDLSSEVVSQQQSKAADPSHLHPSSGRLSTRNLSLNIRNVATAAGGGSCSSSDAARKGADRAPPLPPRTYKNKYSEAPVTAHKERTLSSQLDLPNMSDSSVSRDSCSTARANTPLLSSARWSDGVAGAPTAGGSGGGGTTGRDVTKCSSLVDLANRAMEGVAQMAVSHQGSPQLSSYHLMLQTSRRKIAFLEERVKQLSVELNTERESKRLAEAEMSRLKEENRSLSNELNAAKEELQHFSQWFCSTAENPMAYLEESVLNDATE